MEPSCACLSFRSGFFSLEGSVCCIRCCFRILDVGFVVC